MKKAEVNRLHRLLSGHNDLPWKIVGRGHRVRIRTGSGILVAENLDREDAEVIVAVMNSVDELLRAYGEGK